MRSHRGFSLLEALIASFILFIVLVGVSRLFSTATNSSIQATKNSALNYQVVPILESIRVQLHQQKKRSGSGRWQNIEYRWQANEDLEKNAISSNVDSLGTDAQRGAKIKLFKVSLWVSYQGIEKQFEYREVSW